MQLGNCLRNVGIRLLSSLSFGENTVTAILMYHSIGDRYPQSLSPQKFREQMQFLKSNFDLVTLSELREEFEQKSRSRVVLTFDDGFLDNYEIAVPILEELEIKATFFVPTKFIGKSLQTWSGKIPVMNEDHIENLANRDHEIGCHSHTHKNLSELSKKEIRKEVVTSKESLEKITNEQVSTFAFPKGNYNGVVIRVLQDEGFKASVTVEEGVMEEDPDWFRLPRIWIPSSINLNFFKAKLSKGLNQYIKYRDFCKKILS